MLLRRPGPLDPAVLQLQAGDIAEENGTKGCSLFSLT